MSRIAVALESAVGPLVGTGAVPEGPAQVWPIGKGQVPDTLEDAPDLPQWHAAPSSWAGALARLSPGTGTEVTGLESRAEADRLLAQAHYAYRQLTGCLE